MNHPFSLQDIETKVCLLRFGNSMTDGRPQILNTYRSITCATGITISEVRVICLVHLLTANQYSGFSSQFQKQVNGLRQQMMELRRRYQALSFAIQPHISRGGKDKPPEYQHQAQRP